MILEFKEREDFFYLLQFLKFCNTLDYKTDCLDNHKFRKVVFKLKDFLIYKDRAKNYYQLTKAVEFCQNIQRNTCLNLIKDNWVRLITIQIVETGKVSRFWYCEAWIAEEYFQYAYPYLFPDFLNLKATKHKVEVQLKFLQVYTSKGIKKIFYIQELLEDFPSTLNGNLKLKNILLNWLAFSEKIILLNRSIKLFFKENKYKLMS